MTICEAALGIIWLIFSLVWLGGALTAKRTVRRNWFGEIWWRVGMIATVIALFDLLRGSPYITGELHVRALNVLGVACAAAGVGLAVWARVYLGRNWGMPLTVKENPALVTSGPYAYIRNPVYTGVLLALLGSALINWWWAVPLAWSAAYFLYASRGEEQLMLKVFNDTYLAYRARTWRLIPFIY